MNETDKYEEALARLEAIARRLESGEPSIDELASQLKTAWQLISFCKDKLTRTESEIVKLQGEE